MTKEGFERRRTWRFHGCWPIVGAVAMAVGLGGCSSVPDAVNPVSWYEKTVDYFSSDDKAKPAEKSAEEQPVPGADKPFPKLSTVPEKPQVTPESQREQVAQGLVADRERRRYADEVSRQGAAVNVLGNQPSQTAQATPAPTTPSPVPALPPVSSAPTQPVQSAAAPPPVTSASPPPPPRMALEPPPMPKTAGPAPAAQAPREVAPRMTQPVPPAGAAMPGTSEPFETVVVSSSGVQNEQMAQAPASSGPSRSLPTSSMAVMPKQMPAGGEEGSGSLKVATIQFSYGSSHLDARDRAILRQVLKLQHERGGVIRVVGHASARTANMDPVRHKMVNFQMSADRAQAVASALESLGANPDAIVVAARSDADPVYYEFMPSGEAGNQRAEVYLDF